MNTMFEYKYIRVKIHEKLTVLGVDQLSAPILSIFTIIDIGHFQNRFADNVLFIFSQTY